jgi:hypothetical protein
VGDPGAHALGVRLRSQELEQRLDKARSDSRREGESGRSNRANVQSFDKVWPPLERRGALGIPLLN